MENIKGDEQDDQQWCAYCIRDRTRPEYNDPDSDAEAWAEYCEHRWGGDIGGYVSEERLTSTEEYSEDYADMGDDIELGHAVPLPMLGKSSNFSSKKTKKD